MLLIKSLYKLSEQDSDDFDAAFATQPHKSALLVQKSAHLVQQQATMHDINEDDIFGGPSRVPSDPNIKKAAKKSRPWVVQAIEKIMNMNCCIHSENYSIYSQNHRIMKHHEEIMSHLKMPAPKHPLKPVIPFKDWNADGLNFDWDDALPEDSDLEYDDGDEEEDKEAEQGSGSWVMGR